MGGSGSKPATPPPKTVYVEVPRPKTPPPPENPLLSSPWRNVTWTPENLQDIERRVKATVMTPVNMKPKLLLYGLVGAGKSSFINSVISIAKGRVSAPVQAGNKVGSYTTTYRCIGDKVYEKFQLCDTMGLEMSSGKGILLRDVFSLIEGHIKDKYEFHPSRPISEKSEFYMSCPELKDKICCVIFVVPAKTIRSDLPADAKKQIDEVQTVIQGRDISRILIITKIDEVCDKTSEKIRRVYRSKVLKDTAEKGARIFNMPVTNVHLVKNYCTEQDMDTNTSILLLRALLHAVESAADYLEYQ